MNRPKAVVVIAVILLVLVLSGVIFFFRGIGVSTTKFSVTMHQGTSGGDVAVTKKITIDGDQSMVSITRGDSTSQRGLKSHEIEDVQDEVARLNVRFTQPNPDKACGKLPKPDSYLAVESGSRRGIVYFCEGVGADEVGNIVGPYQDLIVLINETKI